MYTNLLNRNVDPLLPTKMDVSSLLQHANFPLVQHMNNQELQEFLDKDDRIETMVGDHELVNTQKQQKEMVIVESQSIADFNLSQESRLMEDRQRLLRLHRENKEIRENYERNKRQLDEAAGKFSLAVAQKMLETSATKQEEDAEDIANNLMDGEISVDEFMQSFHTCRLEAHIKRIKADKMTELVGKLSNYQNVAIRHTQITPQPTPRPVPAQRDLQRAPVAHYQNMQPPLSYDAKPLPPPRGGLVCSPGYSPADYQPPNGGIQYY